MRIDIITIFPKMFAPVLNESIVKRAQKKGLVKIEVHNLRDYSQDKHRKVDDRPYGGGPGMLMRVEPIFRAVEKIRAKNKELRTKAKIILLCPKGKMLNQALARKMSKNKHLILICGHYEGVDERVRKYLVDEEVSIGDYILTGGELAAMVLTDSLVRLLPGVLGEEKSNILESFEAGLLEHPQYTRPAIFRKYKVPKILLTGNHKEIQTWRKEETLKVTRLKRPDLLNGGK